MALIVITLGCVIFFVKTIFKNTIKQLNEWYDNFLNSVSSNYYMLLLERLMFILKRWPSCGNCVLESGLLSSPGKILKYLPKRRKTLIILSTNIVSSKDKLIILLEQKKNIIYIQKKQYFILNFFEINNSAIDYFNEKNIGSNLKKYYIDIIRVYYN